MIVLTNDDFSIRIKIRRLVFGSYILQIRYSLINFRKVGNKAGNSIQILMSENQTKFDIKVKRYDDDLPMRTAISLSALGFASYKLFKMRKYIWLWDQTNIMTGFFIKNMKNNKFVFPNSIVYGQGKIEYRFKEQSLCDPTFMVKPTTQRALGLYRKIEYFKDSKDTQGWQNINYIDRKGFLNQKSVFLSDIVFQLNGFEMSKAFLENFVEDESYFQKIELNNNENSLNSKLQNEIDLNETNKKLFGDRDKQRFYFCKDNYIYIQSNKDNLKDEDIRISYYQLLNTGEVTLLGVLKDYSVTPFCLENTIDSDQLINMQIQNKSHLHRYDQICLITHGYLNKYSFIRQFKQSVFRNKRTGELYSLVFISALTLLYLDYTLFYFSESQESLKMKARNSIDLEDETTIIVQKCQGQKSFYPQLYQSIIISTNVLFLLQHKSPFSTFMLFIIGAYNSLEFLKTLQYKTYLTEDIDLLKSEMIENLQNKQQQQQNSIETSKD